MLRGPANSTMRLFEKDVEFQYTVITHNAVQVGDGQPLCAQITTPDVGKVAAVPRLRHALGLHSCQWCG
jgi:hypothetical protein